MINESSIKYLSCLLDSPATVTDGDQRSMKIFRQTFPYFVPIRYLEAVESNKRSPLSPEMLTTMQPYVGNWMLFTDFLEAGNMEQAGVSSAQSNGGASEDFFQLIRGNVAEELPVAEIENNYSEPELSVSSTEDSIPEQVVLQVNELVYVPVEETNVVPEAESITSESASENEIVDEPVAAPVAAEPEQAPEPVVAVSEAFLQLIREEGLEQDRENGKHPVSEPSAAGAIIPQPVFDSTSEPEPEFSGVQDHLIAEPLLKPVAVVAPAIEEVIAAPETIAEDATAVDTEDQNPLIYPIYTQDYFLQQGEKISEEIPTEIGDLIEYTESDEDKSLMVMMSFSEWLLHFNNTTRKQEEEKKDQKALKTMWQKEKLAAAIEEENEEIPENVFEMAVNSIAKEDGLASDSLAEIYIKQGKYDKAIDMYRKLSLRNPQKNAYFARKIEEVLKDKQS